MQYNSDSLLIKNRHISRKNNLKMEKILEHTDNSTKQNSIEEHPDSFALIIGAMKSGTTSLFDILSQHPQICPSKTKEPDYFVQDRDDKERESYLSLWNWNSNSHVVALESSVAYTKSPFITGVPERIKTSGLGKFKFIYMLRERKTNMMMQRWLLGDIVHLKKVDNKKLLNKH